MPRSRPCSTRRIVPCLDVREGRVVKGVRFREHVDAGAIGELAQRYAGEGADELVLYDISASPAGRSVDLDWVGRVSKLLDIPFCVAGGISTVEQARRVLGDLLADRAEQGAGDAAVTA